MKAKKREAGGHRPAAARLLWFSRATRARLGLSEVSESTPDGVFAPEPGEPQCPGDASRSKAAEDRRGLRGRIRSWVPPNVQTSSIPVFSNNPDDGVATAVSRTPFRFDRLRRDQRFHRQPKLHRITLWVSGPRNTQRPSGLSHTLGDAFPRTSEPQEEGTSVRTARPR